MSDPLDTFARRLRRDPAFLASALEDYARSERLDGSQLANRLDIEQHVLSKLALCRRPAGEAFASGVERISDHFGIDRVVLAEIIRRSDALRTLKLGAAETHEGMLAAARDRIEESPTQYSATDDDDEDATP